MNLSWKVCERFVEKSQVYPEFPCKFSPKSLPLIILEVRFRLVLYCSRWRYRLPFLVINANNYTISKSCVKRYSSLYYSVKYTAVLHSIWTGRKPLSHHFPCEIFQSKPEVLEVDLKLVGQMLALSISTSKKARISLVCTGCTDTKVCSMFISTRRKILTWLRECN